MFVRASRRGRREWPGRDRGRGRYRARGVARPRGEREREPGRGPAGGPRAEVGPAPALTAPGARAASSPCAPEGHGRAGPESPGSGLRERPAELRYTARDFPGGF